MIETIALFSLISLLTVLLVFAPARRLRLSVLDGKKHSEQDSKSQNTALFMDKRNELEGDRSAGLITDSEFLVLLKELEKSLLVDVPEQSSETHQLGYKKLLLIIFMVFIPLLSFSCYFATAAHRAAFEWLALKNSFSAAIQSVATEAEVLPSALDELSMADFIRLLQADLQQNQRTSEQAGSGWYLLGVSYLKIKNFDSALYALKRADEAEPGREDVRFSYAQADIFKNNGEHTVESAAILTQLLADRPDHQGALMLSGVAAFNVGDYAKAIELWQQLLGLRQISDAKGDGQGIEVLKASIATAKQRLGESQAVTSAIGASEEPAIKPALNIKVELASNLKKQLKDGSSLFVFVKASQGPKIPLAVVRYTDFKLPKIVHLDDALAMSADFKLSDFSEVIVTARISQQGKAQLFPGDMEGVTDAILLKPGLANVAVTIDRLIQ